MTNIGPTSSTSSGEVSPTSQTSGPSDERFEGESNPGSTAQAAAAADANFRLQNFQINPSEGLGSEATKIGSLNAGDRFASVRQNSPATAAAATQGISGTDSMGLRVPSSPSEAPASVPSKTAPEPIASHPSSSGSLHFLFHVPRREEEEWYRRRTVESGSPALSSGASAGADFTPSSSASSPEPSSSIEPASSPPAMQRYVFDVHDVHDMGGTSSSLSIYDESGKAVGRFNLPEGNSRLSVDLAPGNYRIEAQSGQRPSGGVDSLDNFRVDIYSAGSTPSGGGSSGEGGSGDGGAAQ